MSTSVEAAPLATHPIDETRLRALHGALQVELEAQRAQMIDLQATVEDLTGQPDVDSMLARELAERSLVNALEVIGDIEHAIRRIAEGTYGTCDGCHGPIALPRLDAIPYARQCVSCPPVAPRSFA